MHLGVSELVRRLDRESAAHPGCLERGLADIAFWEPVARKVGLPTRRSCPPGPWLCPGAGLVQHRRAGLVGVLAGLEAGRRPVGGGRGRGRAGHAPADHRGRAGLAGADHRARAGPRWRRWRYVRTVVRPIYLQLAQYLGTDPADKPDRWLDIPPGFTASQDAVITLAYPATWNPDAARQNHIDQLSANLW